MPSRWNDAAAQRCTSALALRAHTSRLIGSDRDLVLQGGGNTSLKQGPVLHVKGTGTDLARVNEQDFTAMDLPRLQALLADSTLPDAALMDRVSACKLDAAAPKPSIETFLHAALPFDFIEHTHADAVLAVANVADCDAVCNEVFGELAPVVPYRHSGIALARTCKAVFEQQATAKTIGLILAFHGVVAFGATARASYDNLMRLVSLAEQHLRQSNAWDLPVAEMRKPDTELAERLRMQASVISGFPLAMQLVCTTETLAFAQRPDLETIALQGPPTPQHAVFTKRHPMIGENIKRFADEYRTYLERTLGVAASDRIDAAPRIVLHPAFGLCALGVNAHYAGVAAEIYQHDIAIISRASAHGAYRSAGEQDIARAELEYGGFEQRVLAAAAASPL